MATSDFIGRRLEFIRIDDKTRACLRGLRPLIARVLPGILDDFYGHLSRYPEVAKLFSDAAHVQHARAMQLKHWDLIASATFDESYVRSVTSVGEAHNRLGLEPRWYIGGYNLVLTGLLRAIEGDGPTGWFASSGRDEKTANIAAITQAALLDMDFAISVYLEAGKREKREAMEQVASTFEASIGQVVETVAAASTRARDVGKDADEHGRDDGRPLGQGRRRVGRGFHQRPGRRSGDRRARLLHHRDQPPGSGLQQDLAGSGRSGATYRLAHQ